MKVFASTGGFKNQNFVEVAHSLIDAGAEHLELSSGLWIQNPEAEIKKLAKKCQVMLHNYFPPPKRPFVLNLASKSEEIMKASRALVRDAIRISSEIDCQYYGVHAGFLIDPPVEELGKPIRKIRVEDRVEALKRFSHNIDDLSNYAQKLGVTLLVENNVLSQKNFSTFAQNAFLLVDSIEIVEFLTKTDRKIGLLLDVGHLKVSSNSLGLDLQSELSVLSPFVTGYHLSENRGLSDDHENFDKTAWFFDYLDPNAAFATLELSGCNPKEVVNTLELFELGN